MQPLTHRTGRRTLRRCVGLLTVAAALFAGIGPAAAIDDDPFDDPPPPPTTPRPTDPPSPVSLFLETRTQESITLGWSYSSRATSYRVQQKDGTSWVDVATVSGPSTTSYKVDDLQPDTERCFKVWARNAGGQIQSGSKCFHTLDEDDNQVWRAQLRVTTADVPGAQTDNDVSVNLTGTFNQDEMIHLDHAQNDFDRGETRTYDIVLEGVSGTRDIDKLTLLKHAGNDDWCVQDVALLVNGIQVYEHDYGSTSCRWFRDDLSGFLVVPHDELRAHPSWQDYAAPRPVDNGNGTQTLTQIVTKDDLQNIIEGSVGHYAFGTELTWGNIDGPAVEASRIGPTVNNAVRVDLDMQGEGLGPDWIDDDPAVDIDFNLRAVVEDGSRLALHLENLQATVDHNAFLDILDVLIPCGPIASAVSGEGIPFCLQRGEDDAAKRIVTKFPDFDQDVDFAHEGLLSVTAAFDADANLVINATYLMPPG